MLSCAAHHHHHVTNQAIASMLSCAAVISNGIEQSRKLAAEWLPQAAV
jgi:hypothetical protein